ncbi:hypothetical protein LOZ80_15045 [Paenibacillus sp. HWE-109]|uniref:hypothetical protein n=1 Tax=Paenibacillus sp. HWE-109 TaxID=1306526 RepID=UPI001EDEA3F5|nr:hypothetical protein [Paenibacillus sp. HWE-109]UKS30177.1 hypothetical protein LOZ80_15045 [Paenibacillus sp. HWE-109]
MLNPNGYTFSDVKNHYIDRLIESGYAVTKKQAEQLLIDAMCRKVSVANILETCDSVMQETDDSLS